MGTTTYDHSGLGSSTDSHDDNTVFGNLKQIDEHLHMEALVYPTSGPSNAVQLTGGAAANGWGSYVTIISASTITDDFDVHYIYVTASDTDIFEIELHNGTSVIAVASYTKLSNVGAVVSIPIITPLQDANTLVKARTRTATGGNETVDIFLGVHKY
jgi:hypothetical protein